MTAGSIVEKHSTFSSATGYRATSALFASSTKFTRYSTSKIVALSVIQTVLKNLHRFVLREKLWEDVKCSAFSQVFSFLQILLSLYIHHRLYLQESLKFLISQRCEIINYLYCAHFQMTINKHSQCFSAFSFLSFFSPITIKLFAYVKFCKFNLQIPNQFAYSHTMTHFDPLLKF